MAVYIRTLAEITPDGFLAHVKCMNDGDKIFIESQDLRIVAIKVADNIRFAYGGSRYMQFDVLSISDFVPIFQRLTYPDLRDRLATIATMTFEKPTHSPKLMTVREVKAEMGNWLTWVA